VITKPGESVFTARLPVTFLCVLTVWVAFTGSLNPQEVTVGILASLVISTFSYSFLFKKGVSDKLQLRRLVYFLAYIPAYFWAEIKSHAKVTYLALHPNMPIRPGIVEVPTSLRTDVGITWLANSITMTPGTLSVDVDDRKGKLYVHWIDVETVESRETAARVAFPFERFLRRVAG